MRLLKQLLEDLSRERLIVLDTHPAVLRQVRGRPDPGLIGQNIEGVPIDLETERVAFRQREAGEHLAADGEDEIVVPLHIFRRAWQGTA